LILLRAETEFGLSNQAGAAALINYIRVNSGRLVLRAGLNVAPADTVISQLLQQRVYSLLFEGGHRWIDARRYGRLLTLPAGVAGDQIYGAMPVPIDECTARGLANNCRP